jgi:hypothetical protein
VDEATRVDVVITVGATRFELDAAARFTFGRAADCTVRLDPTDTGLSRYAGSVTYESSSWWLENTSAKRPLTIVDDRGLRSVLHPGRRIALEASIRVLVAGTHASHCVTIEPKLTEDVVLVPAPLTGASTAIGEEVLVKPADRLAMVALFAGYLLDPPRYDPHPRSYEAAAKRLGWTRTQLLRRIEYLRARLTDAGVPNLNGASALYNLAEFALSRELVTKDDLALLPH